MFSHIAIANPQAVNLKPAENLPAVKEHPIWNGRHIFITTNKRPLWISRVAAAIIITVGIILVTALMGGAALAGGITLISLGGLLLIYTIGMRILREKLHEYDLCNPARLSKKFQCAELKDLPKVDWEETRKQVIVKLTDKHFVKDVQGLVGETKNKKIAFLISLKKNAKNEKQINLLSFQNKQKDFVIEYAGQKKSLLKDPILIPVYSNDLRERDF